MTSAFAGPVVVLAIALASANLGCGEHIRNPSGSCKAADDGSRAGYHGSGDLHWLPDCQNPLRREYWRVFAVSDESAATIPRIDGDPGLQPACADPAHALAPLVTRYGLCHGATSSEQVEKVNHMAPADALTLTRFLHQGLRFGAMAASPGITPFPIPSDILDACALAPTMKSSALTAICDRERDRVMNGFAIGFSYDPPGSLELIARLNQLYGIP